MKKKTVILWITGVLLSIVLVANFTPLAYLLKEDYTYANFDGTFRFNEEGGAGFNFAMAQRRFARFNTEHPGKAAKDPQLYRTFTLKPWRFWQWSDWLYNSARFRLPYKAI